MSPLLNERGTLQKALARGEDKSSLHAVACQLFSAAFPLDSVADKLNDICAGRCRRIELTEASAEGAKSACFSPNSKLVALGNSDSETIRLLHVDTWQVEREFKEADRITAMAFSPDGSRFCWIGWRCVTIAHLGENTCKEFLSNERCESLTFSANGDCLIGVDSSTPEKYAYTVLIDANSGAEIWKQHYSYAPWQMVFLDEYHFACGTAVRRGFSLIDTTKELPTDYPNQEICTSIAFSPQLSQLAVGDRKGIVSVWEYKSGSCQPWVSLVTGEDCIENLHFTEGGNLLFVATHHNVQLWNICSKERLATFTDVGISRYLRGASFSSDGRFMAIEERTVSLWQVW